MILKSPAAFAWFALSVGLFIAPVANATLLVDGDFSMGVLTQPIAPGWTITGNMAIFDSATACCHTGDTGTGRFVNIGGGNGPDNGVITQTFGTVAGQTYVLSFLYGAFSSPAGIGTQSIEVSVGDLDTTIVSNLSERNHSLVLSPYQFAFNATGPLTTVMFTDRSTITNSMMAFSIRLRWTFRNPPLWHCSAPLLSVLA